MIIIPENAQKIIRILQDNAHDAYVVGGCVRDSILGRTPGDWDITTSAKPQEVKKLFRRTIDTGIAHGTVTVLMGGETYEVTTYRIDGAYTDGRHPDQVSFTEDLREDLRRRDFTINAMAYSREKGLVDAFGGMQDLADHVIRCVGDPDERFDEDALRILRAVRFACQLGFAIAPETMEAMRRHAQHLSAVSKERIFTEMNKALCSDHPGLLHLIRDTGMEGGISPAFPEIGESAVLAMEKAVWLRKEKHLRWSALMQDLSPASAEQILKELKSDNDTLTKVKTLVRCLAEPAPVRPAQIRRLLHRIGPDLFEDLISLKKAGFGRYTREDYDRVLTEYYGILERGDCYTLKMLKVTGADLIAAGVKPGPRMGEILEQLLEEVMEDPELNRREELLRRI